MSNSSRLFNENDNSRVDLPVFVSPPELVFSLNKRRNLLTVFNPYGNEAQFKIMTTSPERFDVNVTKGTIKPNRRIDITVRLYSQKIDELPEPSEEPQTIDYFRISMQVGQLKGNKPIKVYWCLNADLLDTQESHTINNSDEKTSKIKIKPPKSTASSTSPSLQLSSASSSPTCPGQRSFSSPRSSLVRSNRHDIEHVQNGSNVNLVCTICAIACVITLFLPLALDTELCKKVKSFQNQASQQSSSLLSQLTALFSVSYEMKLGCSFALGLFTYRLISTLPD